MTVTSLPVYSLGATFLSPFCILMIRQCSKTKAPDNQSVLLKNLTDILFYLFIYFNFNFYFILLYNTVLVLPYSDMNPPRVYMSSQTWTPLPPPSPQNLPGSSPCTSPKHPVSCIKHRLVIHFLHDSIHVSVPFSQIIPPSPSPTESKSPFFTSVSLLLSRIKGYPYHLSKFYIYVLVWNLLLNLYREGKNIASFFPPAA